MPISGMPSAPLAIRKIDMDDDLTMLIGPARDGAPLEIGVLDLSGDDPVIIHAMRLRPKFYPLIRQRGSHEAHRRRNRGWRTPPPAPSKQPRPGQRSCGRPVTSAG